MQNMNKISLLSCFCALNLVRWSFLFLYFFQSSFAEDMMQEAQIVQQDFLQNSIYTGKRYEITNREVTATGLLLATLNPYFMVFIALI